MSHATRATTRSRRSRCRRRSRPATRSCRISARRSTSRTRAARAATIPVTEADRAAEAVIRAAIASRYPDHGIRRRGARPTPGPSPFTWVIDPIDGTRSFIVGQLHWATLIALNDGERPIVGVTHQPFVGESFVAANGAQHVAARRRSGARCARGAARGSRTPSSRRRIRATSRRDRQRRAYAGGDRRRAARPLRRRLLLLHAARDGSRRHRHRDRPAGVRHPGADSADRERGRRRHRLGRRTLRRRRRRARVRRSRAARRVAAADRRGAGA